MQLPNGLVHEFSQWALRYVILLWLYLICMIPFDLVQFDEAESIGSTAAAIESIAMAYLGRAGLEREAAVLLLSRLYTRYVTFSYTFKLGLTFPGKTQARGSINLSSGHMHSFRRVMMFSQ